MVKEIGTSGYYVPDFNNELDPSRLLIEKILNVASDRDLSKVLKSGSGSIHIGQVESIGRSIVIPEKLYVEVDGKLVNPYPKGVQLGLGAGYDADGNWVKKKNTVSGTTFIELLEQMGLVENRPVPAPRKDKRHRQNKGIVSGIPDVEDRFTFTPRFYDAAKRMKEADKIDEIKKRRGLKTGRVSLSGTGEPLSVMQVLDDVGALPEPTPVIEGKVVEDKSKRRPVGRASAAAQETRAAAVERKKEEAAKAAAKAAANKAIREAEEEGVIGPETAKRLSAPEALEPEPDSPKTVRELIHERRMKAEEAVTRNIDRTLKETGERIAKTPFEVAKDKPGYISTFLKTFRGQGTKKIFLYALGPLGAIADVVTNVADASPTGYSWDTMPTPQIEGLVKSYEGGDPTAEQRLFIAELPPKSPEELRKMLAERQEPIIQGDEMQEDLRRTENIMGLNLKKQPTLQEQMQNLMPQQQTQGTAQ